MDENHTDPLQVTFIDTPLANSNFGLFQNAKTTMTPVKYLFICDKRSRGFEKEHSRRETLKTLIHI